MTFERHTRRASLHRNHTVFQTRLARCRDNAKLHIAPPAWQRQPSHLHPRRRNGRSSCPRRASPTCLSRQRRLRSGAVWLGYDPVDRRYADEPFAEHIKSLLQAARDKATDGYTRLISSIRNEENVSDRIYKQGEGVRSTDGMTYLCLQCPNVSKGRERHRKDHIFCMTQAPYNTAFGRC